MSFVKMIDKRLGKIKGKEVSIGHVASRLRPSPAESAVFGSLPLWRAISRPLFGSMMSISSDRKDSGSLSGEGCLPVSGLRRSAQRLCPREIHKMS